MIKLNEIRISNLRSLADTEYVKLRSINVLVGRNSAGKSTFARAFPMLRQSAEEIKRSPVLWFGRLVDFGGFSEALRIGSDNKEISFGFKFTLDRKKASASWREMKRVGLPRLLEDCEVELSLRLVQSENHGGTIAKEVSFDIFGNKCNITYDSNGRGIEVLVNNFSWSSKTAKSGLECQVDQGRIVPQVDFTELRQVEGASVAVRRDPLGNVGVLAIKARVHGRTSIQKMVEMQWVLSIGPDEAMYKQLYALDAPQSWRDYLNTNRPGSDGFNDLKSRLIAAKVLTLADWIAEELDQYFTGVRYLKPLRATAERYYRYQDLAVNEIDADGANLPMFLASLTPAQLKSFSDWTEKYLGGRVSVEKKEGHLSLKFSKGREVATNVADMGFGISQVLPIAAQLWLASSNAVPTELRRKDVSCIVIEQPELHLHPEYQARLADLFVAVAKDRGSNCPKIIIETHSQHLINRLGYIVAEGNVDHELMKVIVFEQGEDATDTTVRTAEFDNRGVLLNWPVGFFDPAYY